MHVILLVTWYVMILRFIVNQIFWFILRFFIPNKLRFLLMHRIHIKRRKWRVFFLFFVFIQCALVIRHSKIRYQPTQIILLFWTLQYTIFIVNLLNIFFPWRLKRLLIQSTGCKCLLLIIIVIDIRLWLLIYNNFLNWFFFISFWFLKFTYFLTHLFVLYYWLWRSFYNLFFRFCFRFNFSLLIYIF